MSLQTRSLGPGPDAPQVPCMGLGFGSLSGFYGPAGSLESRLSLLDNAYSAGLRFWDLADIYGDAEDLVSEWVKRSDPAKRDDVFIATKFGLQRQADGMHRFRSDPEYVKEACERSLKRLGVNTIDLYYCHRVDGVTPVERTVEAMVDLKKQGKIRHLGLSDVSASTLRRAHAVHPIAALQVEYSLFTLNIESSESDVLQTARELGVTVIAFSPIGRGILSGQFTSHTSIPEGDLRRMYPKYAESNFPAILKLVKGLESVASAHSQRAERSVKPAQIALAWLLAQGNDVIPIPGTKSVARIAENAAAAAIELTEGELEGIRALAEEAAMGISGTRYPAAVMATMCADTPPLE
ncbi:NADP-dependent oxidoreductase domain-containing protein [Aspergillus tetrazonus]